MRSTMSAADDIGGIGEALILNISGGLHSLADGFAEFIPAKFFVIDLEDFDPAITMRDIIATPS